MSMDSGTSVRVLHCIHSLSGGGAENQLRLLTSVTHRHGVTSGIFCVNTDRHSVATEHVRIFQSTKRNKYNLSVFGSLGQAIDEFRPHILHAWLPASMTIPVMLLATWRGIPCVFSYRSAMHFHRPLTLPEFACAVVCSSKVVSNNPIDNSHLPYRWLYRLKRGVEIPNAVEVDPQYRKADGRLGSDGRKPFTIVFAGRLVREKNWSCLLQALNQVRQTFDVRLMMCGEGPDKQQVVSMIEHLQLESHVQLLGFRTDIHAIMQQADAFVLPSWFEGMSNVLLEAMAVGLPVLASDIPSHRRLIGETGGALLFAPGDAAQLAAGITTVATSPSRRTQMVQAGHALVADRTPDELARQYRAVYEELMARSTPGNLTPLRERPRASI